MNVTVIPSDRLIMVDGVVYNFDTWEFEDSETHAIQWYGDRGEVEFVDERVNLPIFTLDLVQPYVDKVTAYVDSLPPEPGPGDLQYFEGAWTPVPMQINLTGPVVDMRADVVSYVKAEARRRISPTDWVVIRAGETGEAAPADVLAERAAARATSNTLEAEIEQLMTPEDFIGWFANWDERWS